MCLRITARVLHNFCQQTVARGQIFEFVDDGGLVPEPASLKSKSVVQRYDPATRAQSHQVEPLLLHQQPRQFAQKLPPLLTHEVADASGGEKARHVSVAKL